MSRRAGLALALTALALGGCGLGAGDKLTSRRGSTIIAGNPDLRERDRKPN